MCLDGRQAFKAGRISVRLIKKAQHQSAVTDAQSRTGEDEEGSAVGDEARAVQRDAVADGSHGVLAHAKAQVALLILVLLEVAKTPSSASCWTAPNPRCRPRSLCMANIQSHDVSDPPAHSVLLLLDVVNCC